MQNISHAKDQLSTKFLEDVRRFESLIKSKLAPKKSFNEKELVTGEGKEKRRFAQAFNLPFCRTNARQFSVCYQGPKYFNSLDKEICNSVSLSSFKSSLKQYIYSAY